MVLTSAANAVAHTSCAIGDTAFYGADNQIMAWKFGTPNCVSLADLDGSVTALCTAGESTLLIGTDNGSVLILHTELKNLIHLDKFERPVTSVAYSNTEGTEPLYMAACMDRQVRLYSAEKGEIYRKTLSGIALCAAFCESLLVLGGTFNKLLVLNCDTQQELWLEGHEGWVRSLSFRKEDECTYTLASGSQERYIRLWSFCRSSSSAAAPNDDILLSNAKYLGNWSVTFEALLMGHDDWVVNVSWDPSGRRTLLSASADSSLILWAAESLDLWTPDHRLGDVSNWGASTATGTTGGFWTALWLQPSDGRTALASVTRSGSFRVWQIDDQGAWQPSDGPTGHFKEVTDVAWFNSEFLLTTSLDQTTRLWHYTTAGLPSLTEIGRPQIHGYDMMAVSPIDSRTFVSAGDEKVMRVFELPRQVAEQMTACSTFRDSDLGNLPLIAGVPALGLSNKPEVGENVVEELPQRPREDILQRLTLWPEVDKLYGHGYEISCLAVSPIGRVLVSASKANTEKHAKLKFFSLENYHEVTKPLENPSHSLTVNKLAMSPDGKRVLSVSRDRKFMITNVESQVVEVEYSKAHSRIIWDGAWLNNEIFVTGARDKQVKLWRFSGTEVELLKTVKFDDPVTAVAAGGDCIAVGEESGKLTLWDQELTTVRNEFRMPHRINRIAIDDTQGALAVASGTTLQVKSLSE